MSGTGQRAWLEQEIEACIAKMHQQASRARQDPDGAGTAGSLRQQLFTLCAALGRLDRHAS